MGFEMDEAARRLAAASLLNENREASELDIRIAVFNRFYEIDLSPEIRQKVIKKMQEWNLKV
ncbi:MAG: hypothetical protein HY957_00495 [Nitrospirae bacterium]|nr:hypothetical protein [Nitrospirota bacterium]